MDIDRVREVWETLGRDDPLWAILSRGGKDRGRWDIAEFFATGETDIADFLRQAEAMGVMPPGGEALDFGCGVGRLSAALIKRFERVVGVDISAPMVQLAREFNGGESGCQFEVNTTERLPYASGRFDLLVSNIVLQHLPPRLARRYVGEFVRVLSPQGVAIFQVPGQCRVGSMSRHAPVRWLMDSLPPRWREELHRRRGPDGLGGIAMYGVAVPRVMAWVERAGGRVAGFVEDRAAGPNWSSYHYFVTHSTTPADAIGSRLPAEA